MVAACALGSPSGVTASEYEALHDGLIEALLSAGRGHGRLLAAAEPWLTLGSLEKLEWHLLLDLMNTCQRLDRPLRCGHRRHGAWRATAGAVVVGAGCCLALVLNLCVRVF